VTSDHGARTRLDDDCFRLRSGEAGLVGGEAVLERVMKKTTVHEQRETMVVPVEVPVPTEKERSDLVASLKQAEAEVASGQAKPFNRATFKERFLAICRGEIA
jgi:hypothetical protein